MDKLSLAKGGGYGNFGGGEEQWDQALELVQAKQDAEFKQAQGAYDMLESQTKNANELGSKGADTCSQMGSDALKAKDGIAKARQEASKGVGSAGQ